MGESAEPLSRVYVKLWDGIKNRNLPCTAEEFSDLFKDICDCTNAENVEEILDLIEDYLGPVA